MLFQIDVNALECSGLQKLSNKIIKTVAVSVCHAKWLGNLLFYGFLNSISVKIEPTKE